ncbi:right-handed parallel beta-helix repeat-containing protein [Crateriforma spongiae]|uniref:right-handed parallel beta-helix repeat-containing protein n=1 Tax=Crateriforma spongiae TaxID=2724528 RepID=UPI001445EE5F|nr:right-handed parallel beta-helix repeat-containing protein [Crateriforma spongiae]
MRCIATTMLALTVSTVFADQTIDVADHGIRPGTDCTFAVNRLIESLADRDAVTLRFAAGQYDFYPENAVERHRAVSNHDNSLKRIAFPLFGHQNVTIDGGGSVFMFHGRISPFVLAQCTDITLKNFTIDWQRSFHDELPVIASNPDDGSFVVEVDPKRYPHTIKNGNLLSEKYDWQDRMGSNIVFDPKTNAPIFNTRDYSINFSAPYTASHAGENAVKISGRVRKSPPPVGSVLISYGTHPTSRLCPAIHLDQANQTRIQNVTIHAAGGMGVIAERCDDVELDGLVVTSNQERIVSTRADATHFIGCRGTIRLQNCLFEHMLDDGINVHGAYVKVVEYLGDRQFLCEISHFQQWGLVFSKPGDRIALLSRTTVLPFFETEVTKTRILNERRLLVTLAEVPDRMPEGPLSMENLTWYPDLVMKNNTIRENRARGALITTKGKVLLQDNVIASQMHGILIEGDNNKWYESGGVQNITITGNTFDNVGFEGGAVYPLLASPLLNETQHMGEGHFHRNIRFTDNTIRSFSGHLVRAQSVTGLTISGNRLEISKDYPAVTDFPAVDLEYCDDVTIRDNDAVGFDCTLVVQTSDDCSSVSVGPNSGLDRP